MARSASSQKASSAGPLGNLQQTLGFSSKGKTMLSVSLTSLMLAFCIWRSAYLDPVKMEASIATQAWYWFRERGPRRIIQLHLATCLPAAALACFQFIPMIRRKAIGFHRWNGYLTSTLLLITCFATAALTPYSYGADPVLQMAVITIAVSVAFALFKAIQTVREGDIDGHRKWMLRTWSYASFIITMRIFGIFATAAVGYHGKTYTTFSCDSIEFIMNNATNYAALYPQCQPSALSLAANGTMVPDPKHTWVAVRAAFADGPLGFEAAIRVIFGVCTWAGFVVHALVAEAYIHATPEESIKWKAAQKIKQKVAKAQ